MKGDAFFNDRWRKTIILPAPILLPVMGDGLARAAKQGIDVMAKSYYQFKKHQKEMDKKIKKEEKKQRKLESKMVETNETENDPTPSTE